MNVLDILSLPSVLIVPPSIGDQNLHLRVAPLPLQILSALTGKLRILLGEFRLAPEIPIGRIDRSSEAVSSSLRECLSGFRIALGNPDSRMSKIHRATRKSAGSELDDVVRDIDGRL